MILDEDALSGLAAGPVPSPPPYPVVAHRAQTLLRRRRYVRSAAAVVAGVAIAVAVPLVDRGSDGVRVVEPSASRDCGGSGYGEHVSLRAAAVVLYLPDETLTGTRSGEVITTRQVEACGNSQHAIWYTLAHGVADCVLYVNGPQVHDPRAGSVDRKRESIRVRGTTGAFYSLDGGRSADLYWTEPDGTRWLAEGVELTRREIMAAVNSLGISGGRIESSPIPHGLTTAAETLGGAAPTRSQLMVSLVFGARGDPESRDGGDPRFYLEIVQAGDAPLNPIGRRLDVGGGQGWLQDGASSRRTLIWPLSDGVVAQLTGYGTTDQMLAVARSVTKVSPNDPRLH